MFLEEEETQSQSVSKMRIVMKAISCQRFPVTSIIELCQYQIPKNVRNSLDQVMDFLNITTDALSIVFVLQHFNLRSLMKRKVFFKKIKCLLIHKKSSQLLETFTKHWGSCQQKECHWNCKRNKRK